MNSGSVTAGQPDWARLVGHALTGEDLGPSGLSSSGPQEIVDWLTSRGWDAQRVAESRAACQRDERPWPHPPTLPVPSWSQFHSLLAQVRALTGTDGLHATVRTGPRVLGPDERRLLAEKPPHHGSV